MVAALNMKAAVMENIDSVTELNPQGTRPARSQKPNNPKYLYNPTYLYYLIYAYPTRVACLRRHLEIFNYI